MRMLFLSQLATLQVKRSRSARALHSRCVQFYCRAHKDHQGLTCSFFQTWLLGFEFPSTFMLFQKDKILILCSAKKGMTPSNALGNFLTHNHQQKYFSKLKGTITPYLLKSLPRRLPRNPPMMPCQSSSRSIRLTVASRR